MNVTKRKTHISNKQGFALVATISVMVLLVMIALAMLSLSTIETRGASRSSYEQEARSNARMALMIAIGEVQKALGPDQRISSYATILDEDTESEEIDGVENARLLGVWDSWGAWLNGRYIRENGGDLTIDDTYTKGRERMFRRWLVSSAESESSDFEFAKTGDLSSSDFITLVGDGSVEDLNDQVRARLIEVGNKGKLAWWVGGKNQAADVMAHGNRSVQEPADAELASGNYGSIAIDKVEGFENLPSDAGELQKVIDHRQLELASVEQVDVRKKFFDVTQGSAGVLADVRWGGLKKDLNLLFEQGTLPTELQRNGQTAPSPRPMSSDLTAHAPKLANRGFTSFEQMHEYYRAYKSGGITPLGWKDKAPFTENYLGHEGDYGHAADQGYRRMPVVAKHYSVYSMLSKKIENSNPTRYDNDLVFSSVIVLWNPYNVPLEVPDGEFLSYTLPYKILPSAYIGYRNGVPLNAAWRPLSQGYDVYHMGGDHAVPIRSGTSGQPIRFEPGQFRIFSKKGLSYGHEGNSELTPGYDPSGAFGQRIRVYSNKLKDATRWGVAIRLMPLWNTDGTSYWWGGSPGAFCSLIWNRDQSECKTMGTTFDWTAEDYDFVEISGTKDNSVEVAEFDMNVEEIIPFCVVGMTLKSSYLADYGGVAPGLPDYRSKNWLQSLNSVGFQRMNVNYDDPKVRDMQRLDSGYRLHFSDVNSINDVSRLFNVDSTNRLCSLGVDELLYSVPTLEVPTAPITSVAGFAGMRLTPGWFNVTQSGGVMDANGRFFDNTEAYVSGVPGVGLGNSFAQPTIPGVDVYQYHDVSKIYPKSDYGSNGAGASVTDNLAFSDYWDHALLVNDGLWDSWFASAMTDSIRPTSGGGKNLSSAVRAFFEDNSPLPYESYSYWRNTDSSTEDDVETTLDDDGYKTVAGLLKNNSAFNVNSTSVDAWFTLFSGLKERDVTYRDPNGSLKNIERPEDDGIVLSRFITAVGKDEVDDIRQGRDLPVIGKTWTGVRKVSNEQLRKLAEECVKQVKARGPFLNMSDFINRRLSDDEMGLAGALQAAIDYDDESPEDESINYRYKESGDMIARTGSATSAYPNQKAAGGSRFTGVPGYVVQSDILRPLGNTLTVRDDTFVIRAYGESSDAAGNIKSRVWCEATIQRTPQYVDPTNNPEESVIQLDTNGNPSINSELSEINRRNGRRFQIVSFRWLNPSEI